MEEEVRGPAIESVDVDPGLGNDDPSLLTAVDASEGLSTGVSETSPSSGGAESSELANDGSSLAELKSSNTYNDDDLERVRAEERLRIQIASQKADLDRIQQFKARQAYEQQQKQLVEEQELYRAAQAGDLRAQEALYQKSVREIEARNKKAELDAAFEPERGVVRDQVRRQVWEQYAQSFGVNPDDPTLLTMPAELGLKGITAAILKKTVEKDLLEAVKLNPAIQKWMKETVSTGAESAKAQGMARALGSDSAPRADVSGIRGRGMTGEALERALMSNPDDSGLYKAWVEQERSAGRYW